MGVPSDEVRFRIGHERLPHRVHRAGGRQAEGGVGAEDEAVAAHEDARHPVVVNGKAHAEVLVKCGAVWQCAPPCAHQRQGNVCALG